ncbi:MAG: hypothetical protein ACJ8EY_05275 [Sphingomicrobium sp.]
MLEDAAYFARREAQESLLARMAADTRVRQIHALLAQKYGLLAQRALAALPVNEGSIQRSVSSNSSRHHRSSPHLR